MVSKKSSLLIWATCLGNLFEHYDTALFALLAPFLAVQFFPHQDALWGLISTYAIIPLGMLARPVGAIVFGRIGDYYGKQKALTLSLIGMAAVTALMGFLPIYQQIGALAPLLLAISRLIQNFFAAGEVAGGAILLMENASPKSRNLMSGIYGSSTIAGILLASVGVSLLATFELVENGWRILYFAGSLTALFGCILRFKMHHPDSHFTPSVRPHILKDLWQQRQIVGLIALAAGFSYATYSMAFILVNGFIPLISSVDQAALINMNTSLLVFDMMLLPLFGLLANRFSTEKMMLTASMAAVLVGLPLCMLLGKATFGMIILVRICLVIIGVWFSATFYSWSQQMAPPSISYSLIGFSCAIGSQLLGGPTAAISLWLYQATGIVSSIGWYWVFLGFTFTVVVLLQSMPKRKRSSFTALPESAFNNR
jgi:MHS family proline/betaine transporter-like MFS transporter